MSSNLTIKCRNFVSEQMKHRPVTDLPGIGPELKRRLHSIRIYEAAHLYGIYQEFKGNKEKFVQWMKDKIHANNTQSEACFKAFVDWTAAFCPTEGEARNSESTAHGEPLPSTSGTSRRRSRDEQEAASQKSRRVKSSSGNRKEEIVKRQTLEKKYSDVKKKLKTVLENEKEKKKKEYDTMNEIKEKKKEMEKMREEIERLEKKGNTQPDQLLKTIDALTKDIRELSE